MQPSTSLSHELSGAGPHCSSHQRSGLWKERVTKGWQFEHTVLARSDRAFVRIRGLFAHLIDEGDARGRPAAKGRADCAQDEREPNAHRIRWCVGALKEDAQHVRPNGRAVAHSVNVRGRSDRYARPRAKQPFQLVQLRPRTSSWHDGQICEVADNRGASRFAGQSVRLWM